MTWSYLVGQIASLQTQISADVLIDGPSKFIVELPGLECEEDGCDSHAAWKGNQHRLNVVPEVGLDEVEAVKLVDGIADLVVLDSGVD